MRAGQSQFGANYFRETSPYFLLRKLDSCIIVNQVYLSIVGVGEIKQAENEGNA